MNEIILDLHADGGTHPGKGEHHQGDQRPILKNLSHKSYFDINLAKVPFNITINGYILCDLTEI
ncbi:MAG TPA: hypothetical protein VFO40_22705 [Chthoniobacterales bacterium]|nr:hypothetical protein [Chthoniobacterales bacterium]